MRFHIPSFLHYLDVSLPYNMQVYHHHYIVYILTAFPIRTDFLQDTVADVTRKAFESPLETPSGTEARSLIKGLLDPHAARLRDTLHGTASYLEKIKVQDQTGRVVRYETRLDMIDIQEICRTVRLEEDTHLIWSLIKHDGFCSVRLTEQKVFATTGQYFSSRRITQALEELEALNVISKNGRIRTHGREVLDALP